MIEEALSFAYPPDVFVSDYEAARAQVPPGATSGQAAARIEAVLCARYGRLAGLLRAVRMQAVIVALATRWGQLLAGNLVRPGGLSAAESRRVLPIRRVDPVLLAGLVRARVQLLGAPLTGLRLTREDVDAAIARAARPRDGP